MGEIEIKAELGILPKLIIGYRHTWERRSAQYIAEVGDAAKLSTPELEARCLDSEPLADMFVRGARRAADVADGPYRSTLARLVASALQDEARIDEFELLHSQILGLEPAHLRVLFRLGALLDESERSTIPFGTIQRTDFGMSEGAVNACLDRLAAVGLVGYVALRPGDDEIYPMVPPRDWSLTAWGREATRLLKAAEA